MSKHKEWLKRNADDILRALGSDADFGLDNRRSNENRRRFGKNDLWYTGTPFMFFKTDIVFSLIGYVILAIVMLSAAAFKKFDGALTVTVIILLGAAVTSAIYLTAGILVNKHSEKWIPYCTVIRNGKTLVVRSDDLVLGDIVLLSKGEKAPADLKLITSDELSVAEIAADGKRKRVQKIAHGNLPANDNNNISEDHIYAGSIIEDGFAKAVVCAVGAGTHIGQNGTNFNLISNKETVRLVNSRKSSTFFGTCSLLFSFAAIIIGLFSPFSSFDFIGLFILFLSFSVSVCGDILPAMCLLFYVISLWTSKKSGLVLRDFIGVDYLINCDGIAVENTDFMKTGEIKLTKISLPKENISAENEKELLSLLLAGSNYGNGKFGREILKSTEERIGSEDEFESFITSTQRNKPVLEHVYDSGVHYSLYASEGEFYFTAVGSIDAIIKSCAFVRIDGEDIPMDKDLLTSILSDAATASKSASILIGAAVKRSPYNNMKRLSVLTKDLSFAGFIAVDSPADTRLSEELSFNTTKRTPLFFFTDGGGEDINFARRLGIINDRSDVVNASDTDNALSVILAEGNKGGVVSSNSDKNRADVFFAARKAGKHLVSLGLGDHMKACGFYVAPQKPNVGSCAYINGSESGMAAILLSSVRRIKRMAESYRTVTSFILLSTIIRALYTFAAVFGLPFVYPHIVLLWGMIIDILVSAIIFLITTKQGKQ